MKQIRTIARAELGQLFYSPIAWLIIILFGMQVYQTFTASIVSLAADQDMYGGLSDVTQTIFSGFRGLFPAIRSNLYLFIPLLTMGLMSRELSSGSIKLLYSAPVTSSQIIAGKFLAMVLFSFVLLATTVPNIIFAAVTVPHLDAGLLVSGLLGLLLLIWAYAAIGLFMSSLTGYQIVAALLTLGALTLLERLGSMGQTVDFLRDLTYWASISGRTEQFIAGLISTEDLIYFVSVIALFLSFSVFLLQYRRDNRRGTCIAKYVGSLAAVLLAGYFTSRPRVVAYYDASRTKVNTLTDTSRRIVEGVEGPLKITTYVNLSDYNAWMGAPISVNDDIKRFKTYMRFKPDIRMEYVYYYDEPYNNPDYGTDERIPTEEMARKFAEGFGIPFRKVLTPEQIRAQVDLVPEKNGIVKLLESADGKRTFLRVFDDMMRFPDEREISTAIRRLTVPPVRAGFLTGHGERSIVRSGDGDYSGFAASQKERGALVNQGFDVVQADLSGGDTLAGLDLLVVADLQRPLVETERTAIMDFLDAGGNLLLALEPGRADNAAPLLGYLGLRTLPGTVICPGADRAPSLIPSLVSAYGPELSYLWMPGMTVTMPGAVSVDYSLSSDWEVVPLLVTPDGNYWNETGSLEAVSQPDSVRWTMDRKNGEFVRMHTLGLALTRTVGGKEQRIAVLGDSDCLGNVEMTLVRKNMPAFNAAFCKGLFNWLSDGCSPVDVRRPVPPDDRISLTPRQAEAWSIGFKWGIPVLLALFGVIVVMRRLRH
mgnify:CR=1 FL=1